MLKNISHRLRDAFDPAQETDPERNASHHGLHDWDRHGRNALRTRRQRPYPKLCDADLLLVLHPLLLAASPRSVQLAAKRIELHVDREPFYGQTNRIPSLYNYLECDTRAMKKALWIGSIATLVLYMAWTFLVLGVVPPAELKEALATGQSSIVPIEKHLKIPLLSGLVWEFIILAISTSFLAVTITFFDFWADTLKWGKRGFHGALLLILVFVFPLISILDAGGIFGIFSVLFVWIGRYRKYIKVAPELLPGGKAVLILTLLVSIATLLVAVVF